MDPTTHYKICPRCQQPATLNEAHCQGCGRQYRTTAPPPGPPAGYTGNPLTTPLPPKAEGYLRVAGYAWVVSQVAGWLLFGGLFLLFVYCWLTA